MYQHGICVHTEARANSLNAFRAKGALSINISNLTVAPLHFLWQLGRDTKGVTQLGLASPELAK